MADYLVTTDGTRTFHLSRATTPVGSLQYAEWFSFAAQIALPDGATFQLKPKGLWETTIELTQADKTLLRFAMDWKGNIVIKSKLQESPRAFIFKLKSLLKNTYVLQDKDQQELALVQPDFQWSKLSPHYTISTTPEFEQLPAGELLLLTLVHCANYYMTMTAAAVVAM